MREEFKTKDEELMFLRAMRTSLEAANSIYKEKFIIENERLVKAEGFIAKLVEFNSSDRTANQRQTIKQARAFLNWEDE